MGPPPDPLNTGRNPASEARPPSPLRRRHGYPPMPLPPPAPSPRWRFRRAAGLDLSETDAIPSPTPIPMHRLGLQHQAQFLAPSSRPSDFSKCPPKVDCCVHASFRRLLSELNRVNRNRNNQSPCARWSASPARTHHCVPVAHCLALVVGFRRLMSEPKPKLK